MEGETPINHCQVFSPRAPDAPGPTGEILAVMVNFMCQLAWTTGAQIFGQILLSFCEGVSG